MKASLIILTTFYVRVNTQTKLKTASCYLIWHSGQYKLNHTTEILAGWLKCLLSIPAEGVWLKFKLCTHTPSHLIVTSLFQQFINIPSSILRGENEMRKGTTPTRALKNTAKSGVVAHATGIQMMS